MMTDRFSGIRRLIRNKWIRRFGVTAAVALASFAACVLLAEYSVESAAEGHLYDRADQLPEERYVGLVLGCGPLLNGGYENPYFTTRIQKAAELWNSGKASSLIVSGDNSIKEYNEPEEMKKALVALGVPADRIVCDYAGLRTLDSIVRAREIFGADRLAIVSQPFHNARALAIAGHFGIEADALNAPDPALRRSRLRTEIRERGARIMMMLDLWLFDTQPKHMGDPVPLPGEGGKG